MSVRRVMGTEVEYGVSVPGQPGANPMVTSSQVVNAYGARPELTRGGRARWDYEEESPLRDARGFTYSGAAYDPAEALADEDLGLANVILTNGARLYVDHAHPEYSTPECTNPLDIVKWDKAGERVMAEASRRAATIPGAHRIQLYKNNTDNKGASYGSHENYLMRRQTPFADIVAHLTPFFVTRQIFCGAGRVAIGQDGSRAGRRLTGRALEGADYERPRAYGDGRYGADVDDQTADVLRRWERVLDRLGRDPMLCSDELDWVAKLWLLEGYRDRESLAWSSP